MLGPLAGVSARVRLLRTLAQTLVVVLEVLVVAASVVAILVVLVYATRAARFVGATVAAVRPTAVIVGI